jgi:hypothetical protein
MMMGSEENPGKEIKQLVRYNIEMIKHELGVGSLAGLNFSRADMRWTDLRGADLTGAEMYETNLQFADLRGADFKDVDLRGANFWDADLREAKNLTAKQLARAFVDETTVLSKDITLEEIAKEVGARAQNNSDRRVMNRSGSPRWGLNRRTEDREGAVERRGPDRRVRSRRKIGYDSIY